MNYNFESNKDLIKKRQETILRIIERKKISTQDELTEAVNAEFAKEGIAFTQPTIYRDIKKLLLKKNDKGYYTFSEEFFEQQKEEAFAALFTEAVEDVVPNITLVAIKTKAGFARAIALAIEERNWDGVVGTISGEDMVLVAIGENGGENKEKIPSHLQYLLSRSQES